MYKTPPLTPHSYIHTPPENMPYIYVGLDSSKKLTTNSTPVIDLNMVLQEYGHDQILQKIPRADILKWLSK